MPQFKGTLRGLKSSFERMAEDNRLGRLPDFRKPGERTGREQPSVT